MPDVIREFLKRLCFRFTGVSVPFISASASRRTFLCVGAFVSIQAVILMSGKSYMLKKIRKEIRESESRNTVKAAIEQHIPVFDDMVAFTEDIFIESAEAISVYVKSRHGATVKLFYADAQHGNTLVDLSSVPATPYKSQILSTQAGFNRDSFQKVTFPRKDRLAGWYNMQVSDAKGTERWVPVFARMVKSSADIVLIESTNTLKAYDTGCGIRSNYENPHHLLGCFTRPARYPINYNVNPLVAKQAYHDHLPAVDFELKRFLQDEGYAYDVMDDDGLLREASLTGYKLAIFGAHNEYWYRQSFHAIDQFVKSGGCVLYMGGNNGYRLVYRGADNTLVYENNADGYLLNDSEIGGLIENNFGSYYDKRGYMTCAPYSVIQPQHPLFEGVDTNLLGAANRMNIGGEQEGASGFETDKWLGGSGGFERLAAGLNAHGGGADLVYARKGRSHILNTGSVAFSGSLHDSDTRRFYSQFHKAVRCAFVLVRHSLRHYGRGKIFDKILARCGGLGYE